MITELRKHVARISLSTTPQTRREQVHVKADL